MDYRRLGHSDLQVSAICLGTMTFGQQNTEAEGCAQLDYAFARGVNFLDTAEMYPVPPKADTVHRTESIVGNWLHRQPRDKVIVATKVTGPRRAMPWIRGGPPALDRSNIRAAVEGSLQRLRTDYIDLYQLHWPERNVPMFGKYLFEPGQETRAVPILEQLEALAELVREGKVRHIGLSNEFPWGVMQFLREAEAHGLPRVVSIQNAYSLINRVFEHGLAEVAFRENLGLLAYSPLAFGLLSGKYLTPEGSGRMTQFKGFGQRYEKPNVTPAVTAYADLARRHGLSPAQLALSFVYRRWFVASTLVGATSMEQLREDLDAWDKPLPEAVLAEIDDLHLRYMNPAP
ncbi:MAG: NADP(H)-dependent aldo-keto reductase [Betaproteobacteria bacterium]|nr:NADP(H)-dependent aldo-keto reductase [Betaproteobacteria bacterium]